jgi:hypothetical protein
VAKFQHLVTNKKRGGWDKIWQFCRISRKKGKKKKEGVKGTKSYLLVKI